MKNPVFRYGVILGGVMSLLLLGCYFFKMELCFKVIPQMIIYILVPIIFMRQAIIEKRTDSDGVLSFGEAFGAGIGVYTIGTFIVTAVGVTIFNLDPVYGETGYNVALAQLDGIANSVGGLMNVDKSDIQEQLKESVPAFTVWTILFDHLGNIISGAIIALITAAFLKKQ